MAGINTNPDIYRVWRSELEIAQTEVYVENQKEADFYKNISQYMFWGAITVLGAVAALALGAFTAPVALGYGLTLALGGIVSAVTFAASVSFSRKAAEITEQGNVLYSDIDSQNQAHRMVQAFAKAQTHGKVADETLHSPKKNRSMFILMANNGPIMSGSVRPLNLAVGRAKSRMRRNSKKPSILAA